VTTLRDVKAGIRSLLDDTDIEWTNDQFLLPLINQSAGTLTLQAKNATGCNLQRLVEILNLEAGTDSLIAYQAGGSPSVGGNRATPAGPLATLWDPLVVWWKPAGTNSLQYCRATRHTTLPAANVPSYSGMQWTWLSNTLTITPMSVAVDIKIDGRFNPPVYLADSDVIQVHPDFHVVLKWASAALCGAVRANANYMTVYSEQADKAMDNLIADIIRQNQGSPSRIGRLNRESEGGWYWVR
jgi:hypothetical protein